MQQLVRLVSLLCGPLYEAHSANARDVRSPQESLAFYTSAARGAWLQPLANIISLLHDLPALTHT
eukprot:6880061-Lingulodinium_polyedra.AAC.1